MIGLIIKSRFRSLKEELNDPSKAFLYVLAFFITVFYGLIIGWALQMLEKRGLDVISIDQITALIFLGIIVMVILSLIFPFYKPLNFQFPSFYPLSEFKQYTFAIFANYFSLNIILMAVFLGLIAYFIPFGQISFFIGGLVALFIGGVLKRMLQYIVECKMKIHAYILPVLPLFGMGLFAFLEINSLSIIGLVSIIALAILTFALGYLMKLSLIKTRKRGVGVNESTNEYLRLILNNPIAAKLIKRAVIIKILVLTFVVLLGMFADRDIEFIEILYLNPSIYFFYVFNNSIGVWKDLWLKFELRTGKYQDFMKQLLKIMLIPIALDFFITIPFYLYIGYDKIFVIVVYLTSTIFMLCFSFFWSLIHPQKATDEVLNMKGTSSMLGNICTIMMIFSLSLLKLHPITYALIPIYLIAAAIGLYMSLDMYPKYKYQIKEKI